VWGPGEGREIRELGERRKNENPTPPPNNNPTTPFGGALGERGGAPANKGRKGILGERGEKRRGSVERTNGRVEKGWPSEEEPNGIKGKWKTYEGGWRGGKNKVE